MIRVAVAGAAGRMGSLVCDAVDGADDMALSGRADPALGTSVADVVEAADVLVDFTQPDTALDNARAALAAGVHVVIGTSGFDLDGLRAAAREADANAFVAPNFAVGAVLMMRLATEAARWLPRAEIVELHHESKVDAPSGTAKATADQLPGNPTVHSVRLPGLVAHQEVLLGGEGQLLTIRHDALSREAYVPGVLLALERLPTLPAGLTLGLQSLLD
jgi:4-hydroxy-tetrahydrodipicolinate reductase